MLSEADFLGAFQWREVTRFDPAFGPGSRISRIHGIREAGLTRLPCVSQSRTARAQPPASVCVLSGPGCAGPKAAGLGQLSTQSRACRP